MLFRSWGLICACWRVLRAQPTLAVYPIIGGVASLLFIAVFFVPLYLGGYFQMVMNVEPATGTDAVLGIGNYQVMPWQTWVVSAVLGLTLNLVANYCNAAFTTAILVRLSGGNLTVGEAYSVAADRFPAIFGYSIIGATFGLVMRLIQERVGFLAGLVGLAGGLAWSIVTFMVIPVLVVESVGPIQAIKRSSRLLRQTWGEGLIGQVGIGAASGALSFVIMICGALGLAVAYSMDQVALMVMVGIATVAALVALGVISRTLAGIYTSALYAYATGRGVMPGIPTDSITGAFGPKTRGMFG